MLDFIRWQLQKLAIYILTRKYNYVGFCSKEDTVTGITFTTDKEFAEHCSKYKDTQLFRDTTVS